MQWGDPPGVISGESWHESYRILTHYYTGVVIRNEFGQSLTPNYRWNPLIIDWAETGTGEAPAMKNGGNGTHNVDVTLQNTGVYAWRHTSDGGTAHWYLSYHWRKGSNVQEGSERVEITQSGQPLTVLIGKYRTVTLSVHDPPDWGEGEYTLELDMLYELRGSGNIIWFNDEQSQEWFTHNMEVSVSGGGSGGQGEYVYLPLIKSEPPPPAPTPTPSACTWIDNVLENRDFVISNDPPLDKWLVWIDTSAGGEFEDWELYSGINYDPGNGAYAALLGGENDCCQLSDGDNADQYIYQSVMIDADEVEKIAIEYSYCLTTVETATLELDKFIVDLQLGGLTGNSILPQTPEYNNLNAGSGCTEATGGENWRRRGEPVSEGGDGYLIVDGIDEQYNGDIELALVFYSDVNESRKTTFYFDSVKFKVCEK